MCLSTQTACWKGSSRRSSNAFGSNRPNVGKHIVPPACTTDNQRDAGRHVAVLCDGFPRSAQDSLDALTTHRILARAGWPVVRIPHRSWQADWYACYDEIVRTN